MLRTARSLAASFALGAALLIIPAGAPPPALGVGPLPACRLDDILTVPRDYDDWSITLVDWILSVGPEYKPPDLVYLSEAGVGGGGQVRRVALEDLTAMATAARKDGTPLGNVSAYRSYRQQKVLFEDYAAGSGFKKAITFSARPGHSEHQLGLTIDFADAGSSEFVSETSGAGAWLSKNAWQYGWLMSYPKGKKRLTCYRYEPWHYRYVGRDLAKAIHDSGLTIREYLWANYTLVDPTTGQPPPSGSPVPSGGPAPPSGGPTATPDASPSPTAAPALPSPAASPPATGPSGNGGGINLDLLILGATLALALIGALGALGRRRAGSG